MKFKTFITEKTDFQLKDFTVEYGRHDMVTKLTYKGKQVKLIVVANQIFDYTSKPYQHYLSTSVARGSGDLILFKTKWNNAKEVSHVRV
jgi:hypothetical protein|tara:strand:- start:38 stop:304 length:267 start_codon:yes stop_codon:yes gene_type:complete